MDTRIEWGRRQRPRQEDAGHSIRRFGTQKEHGGYRHWIECQCGATMSRRALNFYDTTVLYSHARHQREVAK